PCPRIRVAPRLVPSAAYSSAGTASIGPPDKLMLNRSATTAILAGSLRLGHVRWAASAAAARRAALSAACAHRASEPRAWARAVPYRLAASPTFAVAA